MRSYSGIPLSNHLLMYVKPGLHIDHQTTFVRILSMRICFLCDLFGSVWLGPSMYGIGWSCAVLFGLVWFSVVVCVSVRVCTVPVGIVWCCAVLCGCVRFCMVLCGLVWLCAVLCGLGWF